MDDYLTIIGIDPGTSKLGFSVIKYCPNSHAMLLATAFTIDPVRVGKKLGISPETLNHRPVKLNLLKDALVAEFVKYEPTLVASESPFLGRFPKAYAALVECVYAERSALRDYDPDKIMIMITPTTVKVSAGVSHKSRDKEDMRKAANELTDVDTSLIDIATLDEHAIDAIHVARCAILQACGEVVPFVRVKKPKKARTGTEGKPKRKRRRKRK